MTCGELETAKKKQEKEQKRRLGWGGDADTESLYILGWTKIYNYFFIYLYAH